jgi:hypothetical protein
MMQDAVLVVATGLVGLGLGLILWRELAGADVRRRVGPLRDTVEVLLPVVATVALLIWAWQVAR